MERTKSSAALPCLAGKASAEEFALDSGLDVIAKPAIVRLYLYTQMARVLDFLPPFFPVERLPDRVWAQSCLVCPPAGPFSGSDWMPIWLLDALAPGSFAAPPPLRPGTARPAIVSMLITGGLPTSLRS